MSRTVTMEDVAREAGVSRALVSIAFRGVRGVSDETRDRIFEVADRLGYRPNRIAARLASKSDTTIGVFLQDLHNDVFADIYDGIRSVADTENRDLLLAVGASDGGQDARALDSLIRSRVDIVIAIGLTLPDADVVRFAQAVPMVGVTRHLPGVDSVYPDDDTGARAVVEHLTGLGHRDIVFLANPESDGYRGRRVGYSEGMRAAGLQPHVVPSSYARSEAAADAGRVLDEHRPTAIFAHNDQAALGVLDAAAARPVRVPADLSVVGFDNSSISQPPGTALTTVDARAFDLGEHAARAALDRLADTNHPARATMLAPTLVVRETSGPVPADPRSS